MYELSAKNDRLNTAQQAVEEIPAQKHKDESRGAIDHKGRKLGKQPCIKEYLVQFTLFSIGVQTVYPEHIQCHLKVPQQHAQKTDGDCQRNGQLRRCLGQYGDGCPVYTCDTDVGRHGAACGNPAYVGQVNGCSCHKAQERVPQYQSHHGPVDKRITEGPCNGAPDPAAGQVGCNSN